MARPRRTVWDPSGMTRQGFEDAERRLFARYELASDRRSLALRDPAVSIGVRETGAGEPVVFIHGSGMSGATWAPVLAHLPDVRSIAIDLPGFGLSDPYSYTGRSLRAHAVAQLTSVLDALALQRPALDRTPDEFFEVVLAGMRMPGWREAMWTHLNLALRFGRGRPENVLTDSELGCIVAPVTFIWGRDDVYGGPEIGQRAAELIPNASLEVIPGNHAPYLDDPAHCAALIRQATSGLSV
jgi:pimeloyl-ACP methyl ester carboxylesterase